MIYQQTTIDIDVRGKDRILDWARRMVEHVQAHYGVEPMILDNVGGNNFQIHFLTVHESLGNYESYSNRLGRDRRFRELMNEATEAGMLKGSNEQLFRTFR